MEIFVGTNQDHKLTVGPYEQIMATVDETALLALVSETVRGKYTEASVSLAGVDRNTAYVAFEVEGLPEGVEIRDLISPVEAAYPDQCFERVSPRLMEQLERAFEGVTDEPDAAFWRAVQMYAATKLG